MSCLKDKLNIWAGPKGDTPEVVTEYYTYLCTGDVNHTVSCNWPDKIAAKGDSDQKNLSFFRGKGVTFGLAIC